MDTKTLSKVENSDRAFFPDFPTLRDWFEDFAPERFAWINSGKHAIKVEEIMHDKEILVRAELPGIDPEKDVHIHISDGMLTISGERYEEHKSGKRSEFYYGSFTRTVPLPMGTSDMGVRATYKDGILEIHVPTEGMIEQPKRIPIQKL